MIKTTRKIEQILFQEKEIEEGRCSNKTNTNNNNNNKMLQI